jgi:membrane protease YdiL (CAAX protease family)
MAYLLEEFDDKKNPDKQDADLTGLGRAWYEIPPRRVNYFHGFNFKLVNPVADGIIFITMILIIPFLAAIIAYVAFPEISSSTTSIGVLVVSLITAIAGFTISFLRSREKFWKDGLGFAYLFVIMPDIVVMVGSLILASFIAGKTDEWKMEYQDVLNAFISMSCQMIAEIGIIVWFMLRSTSGWATLKLTFKDNWKMILIIVPIAVIALYFISQFLFGYVYDLVFKISDDSKNQNQLLALIDNPKAEIKISYIILLFISTILIAPLCEEISTRYSFFSNIGNKWVALVCSSLYFGFIHCGQTGDFIHLPTYIAAGVVLSMVFIVARGNYTYNWLTHVLMNLISFILILATTQ